ncbi:uncharacterized protein [Physcomitrium patens]|uniref:Uncharacterized protein n=2 Tax=Physcomitrium patens TaxID=3218 RepID=A0A2K1IXK4_PHYPA|nr:uncharacterized protein LOC112272824 isoform X1 [Physcomitrium patens]PNR33991.1 hypothetical protein PHYPA_023807 [Physcomitrium patens]|eukprot:XP_024356734.1 uncharacterized protein LOC112272824 isoform X1 [Physcomitrella patens]
MFGMGGVVVDDGGACSSGGDGCVREGVAEDQQARGAAQNASCLSEEKRVKSELSSPGPATPMQAAPLPQQKPRESNKTCPIISNTGATHASQPAKAESEPKLAARPLNSSTSTQDVVLSLNENHISSNPSNPCSISEPQILQNSPLSALHRRVGHPSFPRGPATSRTSTKPSSKDESQLHLASKATQDEIGLSCSVITERASSDPSATLIDHLSSNCMAESYKYSLDSSLSLGSKPLLMLGSRERTLEDVGRAWEVGVGSARQSKLTCSVINPNEATVTLQFPQGKTFRTQGETFAVDRSRDWKGKHLQESFGFYQDGIPHDGKMDGNVEQVQGHSTALSMEHGANPSSNSSHGRFKKRVKREVVDTGLASLNAREQAWGIEDEQDCRRSVMFENNHVNSRQNWNEPTCSHPPSSSEKAFEKGFAKVSNGPIAEQKTVVVKKTPKRVHNSDPSAMFTGSEVLILDDCLRSPRSIPHHILMPVNKPGLNGVVYAADLANSMSRQRARKSQNLVCSREPALDYCQGIQNGWNIQQSQLESRLDTVSASSLTSTSKHSLSTGEPSLPLTLNFSPKPHRPVVPASRTSTGIPSTEEEWGKSLALCGPGAESPDEVECSVVEPKPMSAKDRFVQLQLFLKKCDDDDQSYLLDALRQLSAAARSSCAVELEQRALRLSIEEGKEMARLKSLNVMGQKTNTKAQNEIGCTSQGPRVPSFITAVDYPYQQLLPNMKSPAQVQVPMSGSGAPSAYTETCYSA